MLQSFGRLPLRQEPQQAQLMSFPAPTRGLVTNENAAFQERGTARQLVNYFPTTRGVRPRLGTDLWATIDEPCLSMFTYDSGGVQALFVADNNSIFDISNPADPEVEPTADLTGFSDGQWSTVKVATSANTFLIIANDSAADDMRAFDGSTWTTPSITGSLASTDVSAVWSHGKRLWMVEKNTNNAWYLGVDQYQGAANQFVLSGLFPNGGDLLFGTTWSLDAGDGLDDKCIFVSTSGDVAVYSGTDPSSSSTWSLDGVYKIPPPNSKNGFYRVAGQPYIITTEGVIPMGAVIEKDVSQQSLSALSYPIEDQWSLEYEDRTSLPWKPVVWEEGNMVLTLTPTAVDSQNTQYFVTNIETGAWTIFENHNASCGEALNTDCYIGDDDGKIYKLEQGGDDNGASYRCVAVLNFDSLGAPEAYKYLRMARATLLSTGDVNIKVSASSDYEISLPSYPASIVANAGSLWDTALWDTGKWAVGQRNPTAYTTRWQSISKGGYAHALQLQQTFGTTNDHYSEIQTIAVTYEVGGVVV